MFTCSNCPYSSTDKSNYLRHCNRKTACGPKKQAINHDIHSIKHSTEPTEHNTCDTNHDTESVNQYKGHVNNTIEFDKDTHQGKCPRCERMISKKHIKKHIEICKGVPKNTCGVCFRIFTTQSSHSRHQKMCKKKKEIHMNTNSEGPSSVITNQTINNGTINNNNNNITNNINIQFGKEHMDLLVERLRVDNDDRLQAVQTELKKDYEQKIKLLKFDYDNDREIMQELLQHQNDHLSILTDLYFFNKEYPENQTVRKINKKSDLIEFRDGDQWVPEPSRTGVPRFLNALSKYTQAVFEVEHDFSGCSVRNIRDILQYKTKRGDLPDTKILQRYDLPVLNIDNIVWKHFCKEIHEAFDPKDAPWATRPDIESTKSQILDQIRYMAKDRGLEDFSVFRDGLTLYSDIINRFPEKKI